MSEMILDCILDTLKLLPFLFVLYILIELLEHKTSIGKPNRALTGKFAPLIGAAAGLIPMCGFSVMAAKLYERRYLTFGTLFAVFIATSDEALLTLAVSSLPWVEKLSVIALLCILKFIIALAAGYCMDFVLKKRSRGEPLPPPDIAHEQFHGQAHEHEYGDEPQACEHRRESNVQLYLLSPLLHALQIAAVILLFNFAFGLLFYFVGEENVIGFLQGAGLWYQPLLTCLVGLIPNCASSVAIAETYVVGGIAFGSLLGGLVTNAGLGVVFLFRNGKELKRNFCILAATFLIGVCTGYLANAICLLVG